MLLMLRPVSRHLPERTCSRACPYNCAMTFLSLRARSVLATLGKMAVSLILLLTMSDEPPVSGKIRPILMVLLSAGGAGDAGACAAACSEVHIPKKTSNGGKKLIFYP